MPSQLARTMSANAAVYRYHERLVGVSGIFGRDGAISGSSYGVWVWLVGVSLTWVVLGGEGGSGFDAWFGVSGEGAGVVVSAFGLEKDY